MIEVKANFINNGYSPESIPTQFGSHFDGEKFIFFESKEEQENFIKELIKNQPIEDEIVE
jgi:hypothetical protein